MHVLGKQQRHWILQVCINAYIVPHFYAEEFSDCQWIRHHIKVHLYSLNYRAIATDEGLLPEKIVWFIL